MFDDDKIPSNFNAIPGQYEPIVLPFEDGLQQFGADDPMSMLAQQMMVPQEKPKDYRAMSEAKLYDLLTQHGAIRSMEIGEMNMIDDDSGSGKATVIIGRDAKKRNFEIPIAVNDGKVKITKAIDMDADKVVDISSSTSKLFEAPETKVLDKRLQKGYDKHRDFYKGKPTDKKVETLQRALPSITKDEAKQFLQSQYMEHRGVVYGAVTKAKDHRKAIIIGVGVTSVAIFFAIQAIRRSRQATNQGGMNGGSIV